MTDGQNNDIEVIEKNTITDELESVLTDITNEAPKEKEKKRRATLIDEETILIEQHEYRLVQNYREGFDVDKLNDRYSDVLSRYDYIVGDIGFEQLRLKGFFAEQQKKMPVEQRISSLQDYLYEYCNFGCAYFVLERVGGGTLKNEKPQNRNKRNNRRNKPTQTTTQPAHIQEKQGKAPAKPFNPKNKKGPVIKNRQDKTAPKVSSSKSNELVGLANGASKKQEAGKRNFTIRQKND